MKSIRSLLVVVCLSAVVLAGQVNNPSAVPTPTPQASVVAATPPADEESMTVSEMFAAFLAGLLNITL